MVTQDWTTTESELLMAVYCAGWEGVTCPPPSSLPHIVAAKNLIEQGIIEWRENGYGLCEQYLLPVALMFRDSRLTSEDVFDLVFGTDMPEELRMDNVGVITGLCVMLATLTVFAAATLVLCGVLSL